MAYNENKFEKLSRNNKIKKTLFAIQEYLQSECNTRYVICLLKWLNRFENFNFSIPETGYDWGILSHKLMQILKIENNYIEDKPFDKIENKCNEKNIEVILENIRSPFNTGSIMRTCEAFNIKQIHLCGITPTPDNNTKIAKTLKNSKIKYLTYADISVCIKELVEKNYKIYAIEKTKNSTPLEKGKIIFPCALIFGNEEFGVSKDTLDSSNDILHINLFGNKNSINVSVAAGITIYHFIKIYDNVFPK